MTATAIQVQVGPKLFAFDSKAQWVNKAQDWYRASGVATYDTIAIDAAGRICTRGKHFRIADEEGTYPITVYAVDDSPAERADEVNP